MTNRRQSRLVSLMVRLTTGCLLLTGFPSTAPTQAQDESGNNGSDLSSAPEAPNTQPLTIPMTSPNQALQWMHVPDGFKSTLFAAEPDIHQPIAVTTDARGRLWVVECYTYSDRKENFNTDLNDRIVIFEDTDQDGVFDNRTVFWDQGKKFTGIELGFGGVWVTAAPELLFIPDKNLDDVPDGEPIVLLDGFEDDVIRHNIVNGLRWGPDGWLYGRHGIQATSFVGEPGSTDSQRTAMNCSIWRFHPQTHVFEIVAQGGTNPWGFDFDEHGEMFMINTVIGHLFHVVPNARYRRMYGAHFNPHTYDVIEQTADHFHWDVSERHSDVTRKGGMSDGTDAAGGGHAHTGLMIYQGNNWPAEFHNRLFTANFHGRRINSDSIKRQGNSYVGHHGPDYFKTSDPWFRGVEMTYGPDGGVFLLDWSDIGECHENDGIHRTSGRIFKLTYGDPKPPIHSDLRKLTSSELIKLLGNPNEWYSRKARRILQERFYKMQRRSDLATPDSAENRKHSLAIAGLWNELIAAYDASSNVKTKLRIMWACYSCHIQAENWLADQTSHPDEHIRAWAIRLLADGINPIADEVPGLFEQIAKNDDSGLVRLYIASSLPRFESADAFKIAAALAAKTEDANDRVQPKLIWYGMEPHVTKNHWPAIELAFESKMPLLRTNIIRRLTNEIETSSLIVDLIALKIGDSTDNQQRIELLQGMAQALDGWNQAPAPESWPDVSKKLASANNKDISDLVQTLSIVFGDGRATAELQKLATNNSAEVESRRRAIAALAKSGQAKDLFKTLTGLIKNKSLTTEVTKAFVYCEQPESANVILSQFPKMDPEGKSAAINTLIARAAWAMKLLDAIDNSRVPRSAIGAGHARQIMNFESEKLTRRLTEVWGQIRVTSTERHIQIAALNKRINFGMMLGDEIDHELGATIYEKTCANCHTLFGKGGRIGPDLTGSDRKNMNYLFENIVDPSASVAESYRSSIIALEDGRLFTGVIVEQNDRTIKVQTKDELVTLDRRSINQMKKTKNSLMPDGLLDDLTDSELKNLFFFLRQ